MKVVYPGELNLINGEILRINGWCVNEAEGSEPNVWDAIFAYIKKCPRSWEHNKIVNFQSEKEVIE